MSLIIVPLCEIIVETGKLEERKGKVSVVRLSLEQFKFSSDEECYVSPTYPKDLYIVFSKCF